MVLITISEVLHVIRKQTTTFMYIPAHTNQNQNHFIPYRTVVVLSYTTDSMYNGMLTTSLNELFVIASEDSKMVVFVKKLEYLSYKNLFLFALKLFICYCHYGLN